MTRLVPQLATPSLQTVLFAAGLVCLELYKVIQGKPIEAYRNTFANLALPLFSMAEPVPPKVHCHEVSECHRFLNVAGF